MTLLLLGLAIILTFLGAFMLSIALRALFMNSQEYKRLRRINGSISDVFSGRVNAEEEDLTMTAQHGMVIGKDANGRSRVVAQKRPSDLAMRPWGKL